MSDDQEEGIGEYVRTINDRQGDVRQLRNNLDGILAYYDSLLWRELGGFSTRTAEQALREAKATERSMSVIIEDLEERIDDE